MGWCKGNRKGRDGEKKTEEKEAKEEKKDEGDDDGLGLTPEEKHEIGSWILPGLENWRRRVRDDPGLGPLVRYLTKDPTLAPHEVKPEFKRYEKKMAVENGLLVRRDRVDGKTELRIVVPNLSRLDLLSEAHDTNHKKTENTWKALRDNRYWWPKMREDVKRYCDNCIGCRAAEAGNQGKGLLVGRGVEPARFDCVHIDYACPLSQ